MVLTDEIEQLRADNEYLRAQIGKVRHDRDEALALIHGLEADLERVRNENDQLLTRLGRMVHERELDAVVEDLSRRLARLERGEAQS